MIDSTTVESSAWQNMPSLLSHLAVYLISDSSQAVTFRPVMQQHILTVRQKHCVSQCRRRATPVPQAAQQLPDVEGQSKVGYLLPY